MPAKYYVSASPDNGFALPQAVKVLDDNLPTRLAEAQLRSLFLTLIQGSGLITITVVNGVKQISTSATSNSSDAALRDRSTHTGTQPVASVTGLPANLEARLRPRGEYATNVDYAVNDLVHNGSLAFYALQNHTSSGTPPVSSSAVWKQIGGSSGSFSATSVQQLRQITGIYQKRSDFNIPTTTPVFWRGTTFPPDFIEGLDMWYQEA